MAQFWCEGLFMNDYTPVGAKLNKNDVFLMLRKGITDGDFENGERLPAERDLAGRFGVARGTLREGLRELEKSGLVERRQGSGTYVIYGAAVESKPSILEEVSPLELVDSRLAIEPHICRKAVLNATDVDFRRIERMMRGMEKSINNPIHFSEIDSQFHLALAELSGNRMMEWMVVSMTGARAHTQWSRVRTITLTPRVIAIYNQQHRDIIDAIKSREPEAAAARMKKHIVTARDSLQQVAEV